MNAKLNLSLQDYILAGYPAIIYCTAEEERAILEIASISRGVKIPFFLWSLTTGIRRYNKETGKFKTVQEPSEIPQDPEPIQVLKKGIELAKEDGGIFCLLDFHPYIKMTEVWRTAKDVFQEAKENYITFLFVSNHFDVPTELEHEMIQVDMGLPTEEQIKSLLISLVEENGYDFAEDEISRAVQASLGLTLNEAENAFSVSISKTGKLDVKTIGEVKKQIICKDGLLEYIDSDESLETVGGMHVLVDYFTERSSAFSEEAQQYGLPYPKGVLLVGIPGCGKSLAAKALANMWKKTLMRLDIGKLFGSYVGDTEANTRRAIQTSEAMAPCILWLDEIDKGLSGVGGGGKLDSGVTSRMFGAVLTWLQEKKTPVYVIATANDVSALPQELMRKGRFDEIFFVDLPSKSERKEIFEILIKKHKGDPSKFDLNLFAENSEGYTGAEIEEAIVSAMFKAWNDGKRPYVTHDIVQSIDKIKPAASGIMSTDVKALKDWSKSHNIRNANSEPEDSNKDDEVGTTASVRRRIRQQGGKQL